MSRVGLEPTTYGLRNQVDARRCLFAGVTLVDDHPKSWALLLWLLLPGGVLGLRSSLYPVRETRPPQGRLVQVGAESEGQVLQAPLQ